MLTSFNEWTKLCEASKEFVVFLQLIGVFQRASIALFCLPCTGEEEIICLWAVQYMHQIFLSEIPKCCVQNLIYLRWHILLSVFANFGLFWPFANTRLVVERTLTAEILETDKVLALVFKRCVQRWCCSSNFHLFVRKGRKNTGFVGSGAGSRCRCFQQLGLWFWLVRLFQPLLQARETHW